MSSIVVAGDTSGSITLSAPAVANPVPVSPPLPWVVVPVVPTAV